MGFDYIREMQKPQNDVQHPQPWRMYYAKEVLSAGDDSKRALRYYYDDLKSGPAGRLTQGRRLLSDFGLDGPQCGDATLLPKFAWLLNLNFSLTSAYIAKDDLIFAPTENPLRIEKIFGLPYVSPMAWKGLLRAEIELMAGKEKELDRLFGKVPSEAADNEKAMRGRLCFFPTFFKDDIALDIINPHTRETKTDATGPINIEVVKKGSTGLLQLVYIPFGENCDLLTSLADWHLTAKAIQMLLSEAGISAKRNIGYGLVKDQLYPNSFFQINADTYLTAADEHADEEHTDFWKGLLQENGDLISSEQFKNTYTKKQCEEKFGTGNRLKAYKNLEKRYENEMPEQRQAAGGLKRFPIEYLKDITGLEIGLEEKSA